MVLAVNHTLISAALYLLAFVASSQAAGGGSRQNKAPILFKHVNSLRCEGDLPGQRPLHWPKSYSFNHDRTVQSFCAANQNTINTVGCYCLTPIGPMKCRKIYADPPLFKPVIIKFCHDHCECRPPDNEVEGNPSKKPGSLSVSEIDSIMNDLKDFSFEDYDVDTVGAGVIETENPDDPDWSLIDVGGDDEASSSNSEVPQSPDVIAAAMAAAITTNINQGTCHVGSSSALDPLCEEDMIPVSTCSGTSCTNYYECEDDSASSSVNPVASNLEEDDCRCRVRRPDLNQGGKNDFFFVGKCGNPKGGRRRDGGLVDDDMCLCNSTYVSASCCHVRDGMVWETADLKRSVRLLG